MSLLPQPFCDSGLLLYCFGTRVYSSFVYPVNHKGNPTLTIYHIWLLKVEPITEPHLAPRQEVTVLIASVMASILIHVCTHNDATDLYKNGVQRSNFIPFIRVLKVRLLTHYLFAADS